MSIPRSNIAPSAERPRRTLLCPFISAMGIDTVCYYLSTFSATLDFHSCLPIRIVLLVSYDN